MLPRVQIEWCESCANIYFITSSGASGALGPHRGGPLINGALGAEQWRAAGLVGEDDAMVQNRAQDGAVVSGGDDAIIPSRRKRDDVKTRGTVMMSLRDAPVGGAPSVQHRSGVLHMPARDSWAGWERGLMHNSADARGTATGLQGRCTRHGAGLALGATMARGPVREV